MTIVYFHPELPPSTNKLYYNLRGGRGKTQQAQAYQARFMQGLVEHMTNTWAAPMDTNGFYEVRLLFTMRNCENKTYPKKTAKRFKRMDVSNLMKLVEDGIAKATGVDDTNNFIVSAYKVPLKAGIREGVVVLIREISDISPTGLLAKFAENTETHTVVSRLISEE